MASDDTATSKDENDRLVIPDGAGTILRTMAAEAILEQMLNSPCNRHEIREAQALLDLVHQFPSICRRKYDIYGRCMFPLRWLLARAAPFAIIEKVLESFPDAAAEDDNDDGDDGEMDEDEILYDYAINIALRRVVDEPLKTIQLLHREDPSVVDLFCAVARPDPDPQVIQYLLENHHSKETNPAAERGSDACSDAPTNILPIHLAAWNGAPVAVLQLLYDKYPAGVLTERDGDEEYAPYTPLQCACECHRYENDEDSIPAYLAAIEFLLSKRTDDDVHTRSLEYAASCAPLPIVKFLWDRVVALEGEREVFAVVRDGRNLLHRAAQHNRWADVVGFLAVKFPQWTRTSDASGHTPLHLACTRLCDCSALDFFRHRCRENLQVVALLIAINPEVLLIRVAHLGTPLDTARGRGSEVCAQLLVQATCFHTDLEYNDQDQNKKDKAAAEMDPAFTQSLAFLRWLRQMGLTAQEPKDKEDNNNAGTGDLLAEAWAATVDRVVRLIQTHGDSTQNQVMSLVLRPSS